MLQHNDIFPLLFLFEVCLNIEELVFQLATDILNLRLQRGWEYYDRSE